MTSETIESRLNNSQSFANFTATTAYLNILFDGWNISASSDILACKEIGIPYSITDLGVLKDKSAIHNVPTLANEVVPGFFTSASAEMTTTEKSVINALFFKNFASFNFTMVNSLNTGNDKYLGVITILLLTNVNTLTDIRGLFFVTPGGCADLQYYRPRIGICQLN